MKNMGSRRTFELTRQRAPENAGSRTLFFTSPPLGKPGRKVFFRPDQVPDFEGDSAWFEAERVPKVGWRVIRRVTEHGQPYEEKTP
jgi:hypothetical protein